MQDYINPDVSIRQRQIDSHVEEYRAGSSAAAEWLLKTYEPYCKSWVSFLTAKGRGTQIYGPYKLLLQNSRFTRIPGDLFSKHMLITSSLASLPRVDIMGEITLAFLTSCKGSDNIVSGLPYHLAPRIYEYLRDPISFGGSCRPLDLFSNRATVCTTEVQGDFYRGQQEDLEFAKDIKTLISSNVTISETGFADLIRVYSRTDGLLGATMSEDWIAGSTTGLGGVEAFSCLTPQERELLLRFFVLGQTHTVIAEAMHISPRHSRTLSKRARTKLEENLNKESNIHKESGL